MGQGWRWEQIGNLSNGGVEVKKGREMAWADIGVALFFGGIGGAGLFSSPAPLLLTMYGWILCFLFGERID